MTAPSTETTRSSGHTFYRTPYELQAETLSPVVLSVRNASFGSGDARLISDVSLDLCRGEALGVLGAKGSGKSVLTQLICGFLPLHQGHISIGGVPPSVDQPWHGHDSVAFVCSDAGVHDGLSVAETVAIWACGRVTSRRSDRSVAEAVSLAGLDAWRDRPMRECLEHVRRATSIAVALLGRPTVLVLDEPFKRVDPRLRGDLLARLGRLRETGLSVIYATRDAQEVEVLCDRTISLHAGRTQNVPQGKVG